MFLVCGDQVIITEWIFQKLLIWKSSIKYFGASKPEISNHLAGNDLKSKSWLNFTEYSSIFDVYNNLMPKKAKEETKGKCINFYGIAVEDIMK